MSDQQAVELVTVRSHSVVGAAVLLGDGSVLVDEGAAPFVGADLHGLAL